MGEPVATILISTACGYRTHCMLFVAISSISHRIGTVLANLVNKLPSYPTVTHGFNLYDSSDHKAQNAYKLLAIGRDRELSQRYESSLGPR
jgi:hypothetical protein